MDPPVDKKSYLLELFTKTGEAKVQGVLKHIGIFIKDPMSGKVLIFAHHRVVMDKIAEYLKQGDIEHIRIDGRSTGRHRHASVLNFQSSSTCRVALLAITAAGVAITLTAASTVFFAEMFWTPGSLVQAEDRAHRIGQLNTVKVIYFTKSFDSASLLFIGNLFLIIIDIFCAYAFLAGIWSRFFNILVCSLYK
jgi:SWI/SNF-related matrix-associated actin-dependent regulator 1 of chromatin subfamily A